MSKQDRNKILLIIAIILLTANLVLLIFNYVKKPITKECIKKERMHKNNKHSFQDKIASELNLNVEQINSYKELKEVHFKEIHALRDSIRKSKRKIHKELMKQEPSLEYIILLSDSIGKLNAEFERLNYTHFYELQQQLSNEQKEKFKVILKDLPHGKKGNRYKYKMRHQDQQKQKHKN